MRTGLPGSTPPPPVAGEITKPAAADGGGGPVLLVAKSRRPDSPRQSEVRFADGAANGEEGKKRRAGVLGLSKLPTLSGDRVNQYRWCKRCRKVKNSTIGFKSLDAGEAQGTPVGAVAVSCLNQLCVFRAKIDSKRMVVFG